MQDDAYTTVLDVHAITRSSTSTRIHSVRCRRNWILTFPLSQYILMQCSWARSSIGIGLCLTPITSCRWRTVLAVQYCLSIVHEIRSQRSPQFPEIVRVLAAFRCLAHSDLDFFLDQFVPTPSCFTVLYDSRPDFSRILDDPRPSERFKMWVASSYMYDTKFLLFFSQLVHKLTASKPQAQIIVYFPLWSIPHNVVFL